MKALNLIKDTDRTHIKHIKTMDYLWVPCVIRLGSVCILYYSFSAYLVLYYPPGQVTLALIFAIIFINKPITQNQQS